MNYITNEIERSQSGGALLAGCGATPEYLTKLKENIRLVRDIARLYCAVNITNVKSREVVVRFFTMEIRCINKLLPNYIDDLRQSLRLEAFCITSGEHLDDAFWKWCDTVCSDIKGQPLYRHLRDSIDKLRELLVETESMLMHCEPVLFEKFFFREKECYSSTGVARRFEAWLYDNSYPDIEKLRELQAQVVAETLKKGVMNYAKVPSQKEIDQVDAVFLKSLLPYDFEMTEDFRVACARWRRFMHWEGYILIINYKKYGKYIQAHFYEFSEKQLQAIFELDMMLQLINQKIAQLMAVDNTEDKVPEVENHLNGEKLQLQDVLQQLKPLFYNNEDNVKQFLNEIDGMTPNDITDLVNQWVKDKRISNYGNSRKGVLWGILNKAGLYTKSRQNWNRRVF